MYVTRVPTVLSLNQLEEGGEGRLGPRALVSQCAFQKITKVSVKNQSDPHPPRIRSFGELSELETHNADDPEEEGLEEMGEIQKVTFPKGERSLIEMAMLALWEQCSSKNLFRYDVTACETKILSGVFGFLVQLNEGRATKKRPTEFRVDRVVQDFDEQKFHFAKALIQEVLFQFDANGTADAIEIDPAANAGRSPDLVMINVSPIEYGHILLIPKVLDRLTQLIDPSVMQLALQFTSAIGSPYFRLGYNSLGAYATINHMHFQGYYLMAPYPVERAPTVPVAASGTDSEFVSVSALVGYPVRGWVFEMTAPFDKALNPMAQAVARVCTELQKQNVPHNLLICDCGGRVFLWPQCYAQKQAQCLVSEAHLATGVNPAAFEIAGHMIMKRRVDYEEMSQGNAWNLLAEASLPQDQFQSLTDFL